MRKVKVKNKICFTMAMTVITLSAAPNIEVSSTPKLPLKNAIINGSFEKGFDGWKTKGTGCSIIKKNTYDGLAALKISGSIKEKNYVLTKIYFKNPLPANTPVYIGFASRAKNTEIKSGAACLEIAGARKRWIRLPVPNEPHSWVWSEKIIKTPFECRKLALHFRHCNAEGDFLIDKVVVKYGKTLLKAKVTEKATEIKFFHNKTGMIFQSEKLTGKPFEKETSVPAFGSYYVEVEKADGSICGKRYPEELNKPLPSKSNCLSIFKHFDTILVSADNPRIITFNIPENFEKKAVLKFLARFDCKALCVAGYSPALKIKINGKAVTAKNLLSKNNTFIRANGKTGIWVAGNSVVIFYSPYFMTLTNDNVYCPINKKNPFEYEFNIAGMIKTGKNTITFSNIRRDQKTALKILIKDCQVLL
jgi:hypothetical protein